MMNPATRIELLSRRCASLAVHSNRAAPRSLYIGFRAMLQLNSADALFTDQRQQHHHKARNRRGNNSQSNADDALASVFNDLSADLLRCARSIPTRNIAPCVFAVSHGLQPQSRVRSLDWEVLLLRLASEMRLSPMNVDDTVSLLHSLSLHGCIRSAALRDLLFKRLAEVLCEVTRGQLLSVIYSVSALGLGVVDSGTTRDDDDAAAADVPRSSTAQFVAELQKQLGERAPSFSLGEIARLLSKVSVAVSLSARQKRDLTLPFLDQVSTLLTSSPPSSSSIPQHHSHGNNALSDCPVLLLALARVRLFRHDAFKHALEKIVEACENSSLSSLTPRQKVIALFSIHTAGTAEVLGDSLRLKEWFVQTVATAVRSGEDIEAELASQAWDNVTLSFYAVVVSCALDLLVSSSKSNNGSGNAASIERRRHLAEMKEYAAERLAASSTRKGAKNLITEPEGKHQEQQVGEQTEDSVDVKASAATPISAVTAAIKVRQFAASSENNSSNDSDQRDETQRSDSQLSAALDQHMSSHERVVAFITFAQRVVFSNNNNSRSNSASTTALTDKQLRLIMRHVRFSAVPTNTIVAYLRVLGRLRLSGGQSSAYEAPLSIILGEVVDQQQQQQHRTSGGRTISTNEAGNKNNNNNSNSSVQVNSAFVHYVTHQQPPRHSTDLAEQEESAAGRPRTLRPAEAATVLVVMARAGARRPHHTLRLCFLVARRVEDVSLSLRLAALHCIGEMRCPDRHFADVIVRSVVVGSSSSKKSSSNKQQSRGSSGGDAGQCNESAGEAEAEKRSSERLTTRSDAALALIGCGFSYNVGATQGLARLAVEYFEQRHQRMSSSGSGGDGGSELRKEVISRSREVQLPLAIAQVGAYPTAPPLSSSYTFIEQLAIDATAALEKANLPESWYTVLFWRHGVGPLLSPKVRQQCETAIQSFVRARLEPIMRQLQTEQQQQQQQQQSQSAAKRGGLSGFYQLACGLEMLWPGHDSSSSSSSSGSSNHLPSSATGMKESATRFLWLPLVASRLGSGGADLTQHPELVLPAGLCLTRILRAAATAGNDDLNEEGGNDNYDARDQHSDFANGRSVSEASSSSSSSLSSAALRTLALDLHSSLENSIRLVTRSDDLALLLVALRKLTFDAAETLLMETEQQQGEDEEPRYVDGRAVMTRHGRLKKWIEDVCCGQILVPLMRTIATALYIRETAPPVIYSMHSSAAVFSSQSSLDGAGAAALSPPTAQLTCVGLRLLCESLAEGVLFDGEAETFEIAANVVSLTSQRLEPCLSAWDAAGSLKSLMAMATAPVVAHTPVTFTTMDTLASVVRAKSASALDHHRGLCTSVLPGIGVIGGSGSLLSL